MSKHEWRKGPMEIIADFDNELGVGWDTDSTFTLLATFIAEHCDPAEFSKHVRSVAKQDIANSKVES